MAKEEAKPKPKLTGREALNSILASLSKDLGKDLSGHNYGNLTIASTGSFHLDCALKRGGIPVGRIIEIIGDPGTLKTSLALAMLVARQAWRKENNIDKMDLIIDLEHVLEERFLLGFGIDLERIIWERCENAEEALQLAIDAPKSDYIDYVLFDSVDAAQSERQLRKKVGEDQVGGISKEMSASIRQISKIAPKYETTYIFINQIRLNPGVMYGSPKTETGGKALAFYSVLRIEMMHREDGPADLPNSCTLRAKVIKTKMSSPIEDTIKIPFIYGTGFDLVYDVEAVAKELEILRHSNGQTKVQWTSDTDPVPLHPDVEKGKEAGQRFLREHPETVERLKHACLRAQGIPAKLDSEFV